MASKLFGAMKPAVPHKVGNELEDLRNDLEATFTALENGGLYLTDEFTDPPVADDDFIKTVFNGSTSAMVLRPADLTQAVLAHCRQITITRSSTANAFSTSPITIRGKAYGVTRTLTFTPANDDGGDVLTSTEGLDHIEEIRIPANALATGTYKIGFGDPMGLRGKPRTRAGFVNVLREIEDGAAVTTGTYNGRLYTAATTPNGAHDYAVTYEVDPAG